MTGPLAAPGLAVGAPAPGTPAADAKRAQLKQAAEAFEAVFARQMIGAMRQAKLGDDLLGSAASDQFRDMADARLADTMAEKGSFGIAELLLAQFGAKDEAAK